MDLILTGRMMDAAEAERSGLVARVVPLAILMDEALKVAETIAAMSLPSVMAAKEAINRAYEVTLAEGVLFERRVFHSLFATEDQREGMTAFVEKRAAEFQEPVALPKFRTQITRTSEALAASTPLGAEAGFSSRLSRKVRIVCTGTTIACDCRVGAPILAIDLRPEAAPCRASGSPGRARPRR